MKKIKDLIRKNVKEQRMKCGYTQNEIAQILEISLSAYQKLEQGQRCFSIEHLILISNFLSVELPALLRLQANEKDILNQNDTTRKLFLIELLKTFGIGTNPQPEYNLRKISAVLSFIRTYGHTITYSPNKLKTGILRTGRLSPEIIDDILRQSNEIKDKITEFNKLKLRIAELTWQEKKLTDDMISLETDLKNGNYAKDIFETELLEPLIEQLRDLQAQIDINTDIFDNLSQKHQQINESIKIAEQTLARLNQQIQNAKNNALSTASSQGDYSTLLENLAILQFSVQNLESEKDELLSELDTAYETADQQSDKIDQLTDECEILKQQIKELNEQLSELDDNIDQNVQERLSQMELFTEEQLEEEREGIEISAENRIFREYHRLTPASVEYAISLLVHYAQAFETLTNKYKKTSKDIYSYTKVKDFSPDEETYNAVKSYETFTKYINEKVTQEAYFTSPLIYEEPKRNDKQKSVDTKTPKSN